MSGTAPGTDAAAQEKPRRSGLIVLLPLAAFLALAGVFLVMLLADRDASTIPSALIGQPAPETDLPPLYDDAPKGLNSADFPGKVTLVNVWASWCGPCRQEHPLLMQLAGDDRIVLAGFNYKDKTENARGFLAELGDPYDLIGVDKVGRTAINWGVYGVPETFVVGRDGTIRYKHVGPLSPQSLAEKLMPEVEKALAEGG